MTKIEITIRKDEKGQWQTYTHSNGDMLPMQAMEQIALGVAKAKDYLNDIEL